FSFVMPFLNKLTFDNFKLCYFSVDILPQVFHFINRVQMSCFGVKFFLFFGTLKRLREENSG
ncbi:hypothetical protein CN329_08660, partial [Bacillus cereus]